MPAHVPMDARNVAKGDGAESAPAGRGWASADDPAITILRD